MIVDTFLEKFEEDFNLTRGALKEVLEHNRVIDSHLVQDLLEGDMKRIEEHIMISQMILDSVKASNELYKQSVDILKNVEKLPKEEKKEEKKSSILDKLMSDLSETPED